MQVFKQVLALKNFVSSFKEQNPKGIIGLVPTMGALHQGHLSLIEASKAQCDCTIVSIFVNPTQFGANEDFQKYPRQEEADLNICQRAGVNAVFMPTCEEIYPFSPDWQVTFNAPNAMVEVLEGKVRPGHFNGVLQIVSKLFFLTRANKAFFGQKDAQQLLIIQKMVEDLFLPIEIVSCPIVRSIEGLALSSRNAYLSSEGKKQALKISQSLNVAIQAIMQGNLQSESIKALALEVLADLEVEYFVIVNRNLQEIPQIQKGSSLILVVVRVEGVRLLDNMWI